MTTADLLAEDVISLPAAGKLFPGSRGANRVNQSTVYRWTVTGVRQPAGGVNVESLRGGPRVLTSGEAYRRAVERRWGVLFQHGALFSSLNVRQNIQFPVREFMNVSERLLDEIAIAKLAMVGLKPEVADRFPSELSGGMIKRVALARALALDPEIVFLDEPTSGLDPISAGDFDQLVMTLQRTLGLTVFMVTHDLDSLKTACNRIAVLGDRKVLFVGTMNDMLASQHPWLQAYFHGKRARAVVG